MNDTSTTREIANGVPVAYLCLQATREGQGSHAHVHEIIHGLENRGYKVELFEPRYANSDGPAPGALGRALEFRRVQNRLMRGASSAKAVYIRGHFAAATTHRWAKRAGIPVVQEVNGPYEDLFIAWPWTRHFEGHFTRLMREQYSSADVLITVTEGLALWLAEETGRTDIQVIPNGANIDLFTPDVVPLEGMPQRYVVFFGAFAAWQGIDTLLAAVEEPEWPADVSVVFAGDGALRPAVEEAARKDSRVVYIGTIPYRDVPRLIRGSIAGLGPKGRMGNRAATGLAPLKVYETLACATPVIVTDIAGQAELVRGHNVGLVVTPGDSPSLARAVGRLAADPTGSQAMGRRGREVVVAEHSWDQRAEATATLIEDVIVSCVPVPGHGA